MHNRPGGGVHGEFGVGCKARASGGGSAYDLTPLVRREVAWGVGRGAWGVEHKAWGVGRGAWGVGRGAWGGTEREFGASFEQEGGATQGGRAMFGEVSAYRDSARHAAKCAE